MRLLDRLPSSRTPSQAALCAVLVSECGVPSPAAPHSRTRVAASAERLAKAPELGPTDCICSGTHFETQQEAIEHMARKVRAATAASRAFIRRARAFLRRARYLPGLRPGACCCTGEECLLTTPLPLWLVLLVTVVWLHHPGH